MTASAYIANVEAGRGILAGYPMRPSATREWSREQIVAMVPELSSKYIVSPKLDGDRVVLIVGDAGDTVVWNRHGSEYRFNVWNRGDFGRHIPAGSILDGEVWSRNFHPFDCVKWGDTDVSMMPVEQRIEYARQACELIGIPYLFNQPSPAWLRAAGDEIEGVVIKLRGSPYRWQKRPHHDSPDWLKLRWR